MEELTPNWHGIGLEEQKLLKNSLYVSLLHRPRLVHPCPTGWTFRKAECCLSLFSKDPLPIRREEKQYHPLTKETGKEEIGKGNG